MNENPRTTTTGQKLCLAFCVGLIGLFSGCSAWSNPVANGIPVRMLPEELLAESKEGYEPIPFALLQRSKEKDTLLVAGDVLGVYIEGVLGDENQLPPVNIPASADAPPSMGFPIPIRNNGTIPVPLIDPLKVAGMTIEDAEKKLIEAYTVAKEVLQPGEQRIILTMIREKHVQVLVIRQDSLGRSQQFIPTERGLLGNPVTSVNSTDQSRGFIVSMPASKADLLTALARTGGLPGLDAQPEILVYRRSERTPRLEQGQDVSVDFDVAQKLNRLTAPLVIPRQLKKGDKVDIREEDVILDERDVVVIGVRDAEFYYTGGLLRNSQIPMPLDIDLTATEAVMRSGGPLVNGAFGGGNLSGTIIQNDPSSTNPSLLTVLRQGPNNRRIPIRVDLNEALRDPREDILIQDGDMLVLQQTTGEAFARYWMDAFSTTTSGQIFRRQDAASTGVIRIP